MKPWLNLNCSSLAVVILAIVTGLLLTACGAQQPKTYKVGLLNIAGGLEAALWPGFKEGMTEFGYIEGKNITYVYQGVPDSVDQLDTLAQELVKADVDLILALTTPPALAAKRATANTDIPVVFVPANDPVGAGLVSNLKNPGGNITGITFGAQEPRRFEWLIQVAPAAKQVYIPYNPDDPSAVTTLARISEVATQLGVELVTYEVRTPEEIPASIENMPEEVDAIFTLPDNVVGHRTAEYAEAAIQRKLPASAPNPKGVEEGMLTTFSSDEVTSGKQAARLADQILKGIKPANLPVETAEFFSMINLKTATAIGLDVPDTILRQTNKIIR